MKFIKCICHTRCPMLKCIEGMTRSNPSSNAPLWTFELVLFFLLTHLWAYNTNVQIEAPHYMWPKPHVVRERQKHSKKGNMSWTHVWMYIAWRVQRSRRGKCFNWLMRWREIFMKFRIVITAGKIQLHNSFLPVYSQLLWLEGFVSQGQGWAATGSPGFGRTHS